MKSSTSILVHIDNIDPNIGPDNMRLEPIKKSDSDVKELASSIMANGMLQDIVVCKRSEGMYGIVAGRRRYTALLVLRDQGVDVDKVRVKVFKGSSMEEYAASVVENISRKNLSPAEECVGVKQLKDAGYDAKQIAEKFGKKLNWVYNRLNVMNAHNDVFTSLAKDAITLSDAVKISKVKTHEEQSKAIFELSMANSAEGYKSRKEAVKKLDKKVGHRRKAGAKELKEVAQLAAVLFLKAVRDGDERRANKLAGIQAAAKFANGEISTEQLFS